MESYLLPLLALVIGLSLLLFRLFATQSSSETNKSTAKTSTSSSTSKPISNQVTLNPENEARHLVNCLRPNSTPLQILYAAATTPDMLAITQKHLDLREDVVRKKVEALNKKNQTQTNSAASMEDLLADEDGWAEEEDDPATLAAKKAAEVKAKESQQLAQATGKEDVTKLKLEGVDEGVLGANWVKDRLERDLNCWPPPKYDEDNNNHNNNRHIAMEDNPAVERNLLMMMGRLHARALNTHPELLKAGPEGNIDRTYFNGTIEFRGRIAQLLEAALKMACTLKCYTLADAVLDAMIMFKIGLMDAHDTKELAWFQDMMVRQYGEGGTPRLVFGEKYLGVPIDKPTTPPADEKEAKKNEIVALVAKTKAVTTTDEKMSLEIEVKRQHAESFTKQKIAQCQRQGIPPQVALNSYKEAWFVMVRAKKVDGLFDESDIYYGDDHMAAMKRDSHKLYQMLEDDTASAFSKHFTKEHRADRRMVVAWPFEVKNVAQKSGRVTMNLIPPKEEGRYEFTVVFKSMDFLGVDETFVLDLDVKKGTKKEAEETVKEEDAAVGDKKND